MSVLPLPQRIISIDTTFYLLIQYSRFTIFFLWHLQDSIHWFLAYADTEVSGYFYVSPIVVCPFSSQAIFNIFVLWFSANWHLVLIFFVLILLAIGGLLDTWVYIFNNFGHYFFWQCYALIFSLYHCNHIIVRWKKLYQGN